MKEIGLLIAAFLLSLPSFSLAASDGGPNLGLTVRVGQPMEVVRPPAPILGFEEDDDKDEPRGIRVSQPRELHGFDDAVHAFQQSLAQARRGIKNQYNLPFLLQKGHKTPRSVLLVHGLTDSPYYMTAIAQTFFARGYNVVSILLPGHGTKPQDLLHVKLRQWRQEVEFGFGVAEQLGDEVSLVGFSTGGGLVLDALNKNYSSRMQPRRLGAVYLFSPAVQIANPDAWQSCVPGAALLHPWVPDPTGKFPDPSKIPENNPYRYNKMATNAVCQLYWLTQENSLFQDQTLTFIANQGISVFAVESQADTTVSPAAVNEFMGKIAEMPGSLSDYVSYAKPKPGKPGIAHADVTLPPDPNVPPAAREVRMKAYLEMQDHLSAFIERREQTAPVHPPRRADIGMPLGGSLERLSAVADGSRFE